MVWQNLVKHQLGQVVVMGRGRRPVQTNNLFRCLQGPRGSRNFGSFDYWPFKIHNWVEGMKSIAAIAIMGLALSGCAGTSQYRSPSGEVFETSEQMAALMVQRDIELARQVAIAKAFEAADSPEDAVGAAVLATQSATPIARPKSLDERLLPWATMLMPFLANWAGGGQNTMGENGVMIEGTGNTVSVTSGNTLSESQIYSQLTPTTTYTVETNTGTDDWQNSGTYSPDSSTTDTQP